VAIPKRSQVAIENSIVTNTVANKSLVDEKTARMMVREEATHDVQDAYTVLLEELELTQLEKDALLAFLIEDLVANTKTQYSSGRGMSDLERSERIGTIIGESKLQQFLALERNRREYSEVQSVSSMLQERGAPLTSAQRDGLLEALSGADI
jgi:hypothetical protein